MQREIKITEQELARIYTQNTNKKAAKLLGVSVPTMMDAVKSKGIKLKGRGGKGKKRILSII